MHAPFNASPPRSQPFGYSTVNQLPFPLAPVAAAALLNSLADRIHFEALSDSSPGSRNRGKVTCRCTICPRCVRSTRHFGAHSGRAGAPRVQRYARARDFERRPVPAEIEQTRFSPRSCGYRCRPSTVNRRPSSGRRSMRPSIAAAPAMWGSSSCTAAPPTGRLPISGGAGSPTTARHSNRGLNLPRRRSGRPRRRKPFLGTCDEPIASLAISSAWRAARPMPFASTAWT